MVLGGSVAYSQTTSTGSGQAASTSSGQAYPNKPVRIVATEPGGNGDFIARLIAQGISGVLGQPVIVENRAGMIGGETVAKAPPDGYTLICNGGGLWLAPFVRDKVPYDPVRDFSPITLTHRAPVLIVVHPSLPVKSIKELIALAKASPGVLDFSVGSIGSSPHLAAELFKSMANIDMVRIPYKGGGAAAIIALISGEVHLSFASAASVAPHVKSGRLRALAVTSAEPSALAPGLPTVAASGLPGYELEVTTGLFAPAKTPEVIINRLNQEIVRFLNTAAAKEKSLSAGAEAAGTSPEEFAAYIKAEMTRMGKVIKDAGIRVD
jgi:tripartite-type tricarboxylate transporter receptor subunit TctC